MNLRPIFSTLATALLPLLVLCACQRDMGTLTLQEARDYLNTPTTLSRGVDYLGSDEEFHYFEHRLEIARDVRFRIRCTDGIYLPHETMPYRSWARKGGMPIAPSRGYTLPYTPISAVKSRGAPTPARLPCLRSSGRGLAPYISSTSGTIRSDKWSSS